MSLSNNMVNFNLPFLAWIYNYIFTRLVDIPTDNKIEKFYKVLWLSVLLKRMEMTVKGPEDLDVFIERCKVYSHSSPEKK